MLGFTLLIFGNHLLRLENRFHCLLIGIIYFMIGMGILGYRYCTKMDDKKNYSELTFEWRKPK